MAEFDCKLHEMARHGCIWLDWLLLAVNGWNGCIWLKVKGLKWLERV